MGARALNFGGAQVVAFGDAQCGVVQAQYRVGLFGEPARVAEFECGHGRRGAGKRRRGEEVGEQRGVGLEVWRKLEQHRPQLARGAHRFQHVDEPAGNLVAVAQAAEVGDALRGFEAEPEAGRRGREPSGQRRCRRKRAKGVVDLDRVELRRVVLQKALCR